MASEKAGISAFGHSDKYPDDLKVIRVFTGMTTFGLFYNFTTYRKIINLIIIQVI